MYFRGGVYSGDYTVAIAGTAENPTIFKPYNNEQVIIDGDLIINGAHTHWYDFEKRLTGGTRTTEEEGSAPAIVDGQLTVNASGVKVINCVIYDHVNNGVGWWASASGGELYGCVIVDNGWIAPDRGHGHGIYTQNAADNDTKTIKHCVLAQSFAGSTNSSNLAVWGSGPDLKHYDITESVMINGRQLIGGGGVEDITVDECHIYDEDLTLGYDDDDNVDVTLIDCRIHGVLNPLFMPTWTMSGCTIYNGEGDDATERIIYSQEPAAGVTAYNLSGNKYHYVGSQAEPFFVNTVDSFDFAGWKARYSTDADSTYSTEAPATNEVFVYPNDYDADRLMVVIWNWESLESVSVDVSAVLSAGDTYLARQVTDYFNDTETGTVALDGTITFDMRAGSHSVSTPNNYTEPLIDVTFPRFGCFVVVKT